MEMVHIIQLRSYGFIHPGKERWRRTIKRCWELIPGSMLYGALADALIRLDCDEIGPSKSRCEPKVNVSREGLCARCGYASLLDQIEANNIRFSPLIPSKEPIRTAMDYCRAATRLKEQVSLTTNPHVVINRLDEKAEEELLFGIQTHSPFMDYYGFVIASEEFLTHLRRSLRCLLISPFGGGQGKFARVEGWVMDSVPDAKFMDGLLKQFHTSSPLKLLTPMIAGTPDNWLFENASELYAPRITRYRIWRTGLYKENGGWKQYGTPGNEQSVAVLGIPEETSFSLKPENLQQADLNRTFLYGIGNPDWKYLGWGQVIADV